MDGTCLIERLQIIGNRENRKAAEPAMDGIAGAIIARIIAGVIGGIVAGQPSIGFLAGAGAGVLIALLFWLKERRG